MKKTKEKEFVGFITVRHGEDDFQTFNLENISESRGVFFKEIKQRVEKKFGEHFSIIAYGIEEL